MVFYKKIHDDESKRQIIPSEGEDYYDAYVFNMNIGGM